MKLFNSEQSPAEQISKSELEHVLVMHLGDIRDIVMLSPALRALRQALPGIPLTLLTSAAGSQMAPLLPWVDHVMVDPTVGQDGTGNRSINPREELALIECLRLHNFSIALIFSGVSQSPVRAGLACYLAGIPYRVAFAKGMSGSVLSHPLPPPADDLHQVDRNLSLLRALDIVEADHRMELDIPENIENRANELLGMVGLRLNTPYTILAPGSMGVFGSYAPDHFAAVARILAAQAEQPLLVVGTSAEAAIIEPVLRVADENLYGNVYSLVEKTTLPELSAIIRQASLTIANNSIHMHFADVFGCPMVILHSERDRVNQWMPRNAPVRLLSRPAACSSCDEADCPRGINCLDIRPEEVAIAALEMLTKQTYSSQSSYKEIFSYRMELEKKDRDHSAIR